MVEFIQNLLLPVLFLKKIGTRVFNYTRLNLIDRKIRHRRSILQYVLVVENKGDCNFYR